MHAAMIFCDVSDILDQNRTLAEAHKRRAHLEAQNLQLRNGQPVPVFLVGNKVEILSFAGIRSALLRY
jgi:hypothetical protein